MECSICFSNIRKKKKLDCNHEFCEECINKWTNQYNKESCPLCRCSIKNDERNNLNIYDNYLNCRVYEGNLNSFRPYVADYLSNQKISNCVNNSHDFIINKPYGVIINCINCKKCYAFNA